MGVPKPLYLGSGLPDLQAKANLGNTSSFNAKALCSSSEKLFKAALLERDLGDQEKAYILFYKYVECVQRIQKHHEYKKDEKYYVSMFNLKKNMRLGIENLETLTTALERRYEEKEAEAVAEKLSKVARLNADMIVTEGKLSPKFGDNKITSTPKSSRDGGHSTLNRNGLKVEPTSGVIDVDASFIRNSETNPANGHVEEENLITAKKLMALIQEKSTSFFILDTRPSTDYNDSRMNLPNSVNIPEEILSPGITAASVGRKLPVHERPQWDRRTGVDKLIICDWTSSTWSGAPETLKAALTTWDPGARYPHPPLLLEGGFQKFLFAFPHHVTNPKARAPSSKIPGPSVYQAPSLAGLDYPDLDAGFMVTPSPSPKALAAQRSGALQISKEPPSSVSTSSVPPSNAYPSLSSISSVPTVAAAPLMPDRSTKPTDTTRPRERSDAFSRKSTDSEVGQLNMAMFPSSLNSSLASSSSLNTISRNSSSSSVGTLNTALVEDSRRPTVDRASKREALARYLQHPENMGDLLEVEEEIAETSLRREQEKWQLEEKWEELRLRKEREAEGEMREMILREQDKLVDELEKLREEAKEKEENERVLMGELKAVRQELKAKEEEKMRLLAMEEIRRGEREQEEKARAVEQAREAEIRRKEKERLELMESVERKRKERKERERRRKEEEGRRRPESPPRGVVGLKNQLKDEPVEMRRGEERGRSRLRSDGEGEGGGRMKRSFSSPNIAQMMDQDGPGSGSVPVPKFDRKSKPSLISSRNFAGVWGTGKPGLTGLRNLGNTCYMNSILQCVSNTPPLAHYFISRSYEEDLNQKYSETKGYVAAEFAEVLKALWSSQFKSIAPSDFKTQVGRFKYEFAGRDQQDSHEFVSKLLEWLHGDTNRVQRPSKEPEQNWKDKMDIKAARQHWRNYLERNQSIVVQLFCGQTRSVLTCLSCRGESVTYREFTNLTLPLPETSARVNLRDCFHELLKEERIDEFNCEQCKRSRPHSKKIDIVKLPPLLVLHLSRFYQEGLYTRKKQNFVNFDLQGVDMSRFALEGFDNKFSKFNLYAVSNHFGSLEGGHYTAYCNSNVQRRWHKFDDQDVSAMEPGDVVTPAAYILFYSAIEGQTSLPPLAVPSSL